MSTVRQIQRTYSVIVFLSWLGIALPLPLSVLLMQARGMGLLQIGIMMGVYSLTIVLLELPTGGLADAVGRQRVGLISYFVQLLAGFVFLLAFSFPVFLLASILNGIARALSSGTLDAWFVDSLLQADPEIELQPYLARVGTLTFMALGIGTILGSLIPGWFAWLPPEGAGVLTPMSIPVLIALFPRLALIIIVHFFVREARASVQPLNWKSGFAQVPANIRQAISFSSQSPIIRLLIAGGIIAGFVLAGLETFWQPHFAAVLEDAGSKHYLFGVIMGGNFIVGMIGNQLATWLVRCFKGRHGLVSAVFQLLRGAFLILLAIQTAALPAMLYFWLVYLNMGIINSPVETIYNSQIPAERRSAMLSVGSLVSYLGSIAGSVMLGYIAESSSIMVAWAICGAGLILAAFLYLKTDMLLGERGFIDDRKTAVVKAS